MAAAGSPVYDPLNQYKSFGPDIGVVDGPLEYFTTAGVRLPLPFSTRMTVVRLANGDLFLHSPIAFDAGLAEQLRTMGTVRHLVSPNQFHYAHIGEWGRAFPDAVTWASPRVRRRARARGIDVQFKRDLARIRLTSGEIKSSRPSFPEGTLANSSFSINNQALSYWPTRY